ncbi:YicC family protein [Candidatus Borreliella tachyglossi]|uniref:YicC family protein n=1 Tax=Candidatus Borreliella tachyglossi TaxID=1964448 RepID=A0A2S1LXY7_9SPIR|nr:YicC/YloC family endoribonuclease [Candidatus Borreliella tachyglossi]AWG43163.1 YicC family protein [Candidatus Borreliella tachyglossi]
MKSMTGFFHLEKIVANYMFSINLKSYNGKFLEFKFKLPEVLYPYELEIKNLISSYISRGNVFLSVGYKEIVPNIDFNLNPNYVEAIARLRDKLLHSNLNIKDEISLGDFLSLKGALVINEDDGNQGMIYSTFKGVLEETLLSYDKSRIFEGENTKQDIVSILALIQEDLECLKKSQNSINTKLFVTLKENLLKLLDDVNNINIAEEAAKMSIRLDINEEIVRLYSHIGNFYKSIKSEVCGKILEFLTQEMHREITTMSNKAIDLDVRNLVLNMKLNLEKIKEQVRNIE